MRGISKQLDLRQNRQDLEDIPGGGEFELGENNKRCRAYMMIDIQKDDYEA